MALACHLIQVLLFCYCSCQNRRIVSYIFLLPAALMLDIIVPSLYHLHHDKDLPGDITSAVF